MASFVYKTKEQIPCLEKVGELRVIPAADKKSSADCWHVVFSPDEKHLSWIAGNRRIALASCDTNKSCLKTRKTDDDETNEENVNKPPSPYVIDTGYVVYCVAFGYPSPGAANNSKQKHDHWTWFHFGDTPILATGHANGRICIWEVNTRKLLLELMDHKMAVRDLTFAPDGSLRLVSASQDKTLKMWDLFDDGNMFKTLKGHKAEVLCCSWSPNAHILASTAGKEVVVWNMESYCLQQHLHGHLHNVVACEFSSDGALLATASWDSRCILWDPYTGEVVRTLCHLYPLPRLIFASGPNGAWVRGVSFDKFGTHLATVADDGFVRVWNLLSDCDPEAATLTEDEMLGCSFSTSGRVLAVGTSDGNVTLYSSPQFVPPLMHLSRMAVRKCLPTPDIKSLDIPESLKSYLEYKHWK